MLFSVAAIQGRYEYNTRCQTKAWISVISLSICLKSALHHWNEICFASVYRLNGQRSVVNIVSQRPGELKDATCRFRRLILDTV